MTLFSTNGRTGAGNTIGDLLKGRFGKKILKKDFTINRPQTLFGPDWSQLEKGRCPHCACRLYAMPSKPDFFRCKSKQHRKSFVVHKSKVIHTTNTVMSAV